MLKALKTQLINLSDNRRTIMDGHLNILQMIASSGTVVKIVLGILIFASTYSWAIILKKRNELKSFTRSNEEFLNFYRNNVNLNDIFVKSKEMEYSPYQSIFQRGYEEFIKIREGLKQIGKDMLQDHFSSHGLLAIERAIKRSLNDSTDKMDADLQALASIGSIAPFIGLFGTVWGIIDAFVALGEGVTSLDAVAPGIAEALVTTAIGLFTAIPAVFFYNYFSSSINKISMQTESYSQEFLNMLERLILKSSRQNTSSSSTTSAGN